MRPRRRAKTMDPDRRPAPAVHDGTDEFGRPEKEGTT